MKHPERPSERNLEVSMYVMSGLSLAKAGLLYGLSGPRVRQIMQKVCIYLRPDLFERCKTSSGALSVRALRYAHLDGDSLLDDLYEEQRMGFLSMSMPGPGSSRYMMLRQENIRLRSLLSQKEKELEITEDRRKHLAVRLSGLDRNEEQIRRFSAHNMVMRETIESIREELARCDVKTQKVHDE